MTSPFKVPPSWTVRVQFNGQVLLAITAPLVAAVPALERTLGLCDSLIEHPADEVRVEMRRA